MMDLVEHDAAADPDTAPERTEPAEPVAPAEAAEPAGTAPTAEWPVWSTPDAPVAAARPVPPAWPAAPATPPVAAAESATGGTPPRRAALLGALAGGLVAALVATGISVALDDDDATGTRTVATPIVDGSGALDIQGILTKVQQSVVAIETSSTTSRGVFGGAGSGIILSADGLVLTNAHVVAGLGEITVVLPDGTRADAVLVGASPADDVALVQVQDVSDLQPADLGSSDDLRVGDEVIAIGNALNLGDEPTVTRGIVSAKDRDLTAEGVNLQGLIQTDAAINRGNSGGPLVNAAGEVVGMNTAIVADAQNLGFSIAIDQVSAVIDAIKRGDGAVTPDQAFLGVSSTDVSELTDVVRERFSITVDDGAFVTEVVPGSAADDGGLEIGDVIVEVDGAAVRGASDVRDNIVSHEPGDEIDLRILRDGEEQTITVTLGRRGDGA